MAFVRYVALVALVVWVGGLLVLGLLVAPATFGVLHAAAPSGGALAGAVVGDVLRSFHFVAYGCGAVIIICLFAMKFVGPPPRSFPLRAFIAAAMLLTAVYSGTIVAAEMRALQRSIAAGPGALPESDARRVRFDTLHRRTTVLMTANIIGGLILLGWYVRE